MASDLRSLYALSQSARQQGDLARAISISDEMLQASRYAPQACGWAASLRLDARQWQQAIDIAKVGLMKGRSGDLFGILGQAYLARSEQALAETAFREAIREQPAYAPWKFHLAQLLLRQDREFEAMQLLRDGVAILPDEICLVRLAQLELAYNQPEAALRHAERALEIDPNDGSAHMLAAKSLMEFGRDEEADTHWRRTHELMPGNSQEVDLTRAKFLRELGQFKCASSALEEILAEHPNSVEALTLLVENPEPDGTGTACIPNIEALLEKDELLASERMSLEYAAGKAHEDAGEFEVAMRHFDRANAIGREATLGQRGFDRDQYSAMIQARKETYGAEAVSAPLRDSGSVDPIFVVGNLRSGTTLMEQILRRHPEANGAGEQKFWLSLERRITDLEHRTIRRDALQEARDTYTRLLETFRGNAQYVVDKQPANLLLAGLLSMAFPEGRILYMRREPIDNAISIWNTRLQTTAPFVHDKGNLASALQQHEGLKRHWEEVLPSDRFMVVPYESLVTEQETWTRKLIEFCGLSWDDACLSPEKADDRVTTPSLWQVRQPVYRTSIDRWKNYEPWLGEFESLR